jgi:large subunit ribosomal protein L4
MPKVDVYDIKGKKVSDVELNENVFGIEPNETIVHSVLMNYLANQRQGTQSTKTRAEVRGGGRKPWRQKGTGRARQGSIRAPQWIKGGIALGPKPRSYRYSVNKKEKRLAIRSVLSSKVLENELTVVDKLELKEIKTKSMVKAFADLKVAGKTLVILPEKNLNVQASTNNIKDAKVILLNEINVYDLLKYTNLVLPLDTVKKIEEVYA